MRQNKEGILQNLGGRQETKNKKRGEMKDTSNGADRTRLIKRPRTKKKESVRALRVRFVLLYGSFHMLLYNKSNGITKTNALCVLENSPFTT